MTELNCINGPVFERPDQAFAALKQWESGNTFPEFSIYQCRISPHFHLKHDYGATRDIACNTKRYLHSKSDARKKLKEMRRAGRTTLVAYACWYSEDPDDPHYHLGHPAGNQTYLRAGRVYG